MPEDKRPKRELSDSRRRRKTAKMTLDDILKRRATSMTVTPATRVEAAFRLAYERTWGFPYFQTSPSEDRHHINAILEQLGEDAILRLVNDFFDAVRPIAQGGDPVVSKCRCSNVRDFNYHAQYLLLKRQRGPQLAGRTADNVVEIRKAMGRK